MANIESGKNFVNSHISWLLLTQYIILKITFRIKKFKSKKSFFLLLYSFILLVCIPFKLRVNNIYCIHRGNIPYNNCRYAFMLQLMKPMSDKWKLNQHFTLSDGKATRKRKCILNIHFARVCPLDSWTARGVRLQYWASYFSILFSAAFFFFCWFYTLANANQLLR